MVAFCDDPDVLGAPFYLMEFVDGIVYTDADDVSGLVTESQALAATDELVDVLARLHSVDYEAVGLGDLGRPDGFLERQIARWRTQWEQLQAAGAAGHRGARRPPRALAARAHQAPAVVHGDYSFNNTMWVGRRPHPHGRGARLGDVDPRRPAHRPRHGRSSTGGRCGELMWRSRTPQPHRAQPGLPRRRRASSPATSATVGRSVRDIDVYRVLAAFKLAVITEGAHARIAANDPDAAPRVRETVESLAAMALEMADTSSIPSLRGA